MNPTEIKENWARRLREFLPEYIDGCAALRTAIPEASIVFHGSTTLGVDDPYSDLDIWMLAPSHKIEQADALSTTRFFEFKLDGKPGHLNLESREDFACRVGECDMQLMAELRPCEVLLDTDGFASELASRARQPMSDAVRRAWFCYHYVEMRSEHRACDNPIERRDGLALLQALVPAIGHALRAAMVLDGEPYPYGKWLGRAAAATPTGRLVAAKADEILALLGTDALRLPGPEKQHPLSLKLREIRALLIAAARAAGIDEPWLTSWWLYMTKAREGVRATRW
ncbi:MAG: hypothetical protein M1457_00695 [bacterium]|nr:hypothetical protein [bacterium]